MRTMSGVRRCAPHEVRLCLIAALQRRNCSRLAHRIAAQALLDALETCHCRQVQLGCAVLVPSSPHILPPISILQIIRDRQDPSLGMSVADIESNVHGLRHYQPSNISLLLASVDLKLLMTLMRVKNMHHLRSKKLQRAGWHAVEATAIKA